MGANDEAANSLNSSHKLHLLTSCQYADKLLGEIESVLIASTSKSPFPKYKPDISPIQAKVVQDYIARIRAQMLRILESQGIQPPEPQFGSVHSIRVAIGFAEITFDECRPQNMRGYGEFPDTAVAELNGLVNEMKGLLGKVDSYLAQGLGQDLQARLEKLQRAGSDVRLVATLERIIDAHGLVEFRAALDNIVTRAESTSFEIAFFGRVSSGKSSLLNRIVQQDVLPVGVTPVTAVPTRIVFGPSKRAIAWFAGRNPESFAIERLAEYVTEQFNPSNSKHVSKIVVELPSARLRDGVVYVDTPGLGSLASAGSAETMAYLPRCDLGVVLIDAGSTLTPDDLSTIRALYDAAVPVFVLLSKSDLLGVADQERVRSYVESHIRSELGLQLPVHPVSAKPECAELLEQWFQDEILPLYGRHAELWRESLNRKIGALRAAVEAALRSGLRQPAGGAGLRALETELRKAAGRFADVRSDSTRIADEIRECGERALERASQAIVDAWTQGGDSRVDPPAIVSRAVEQFAAQLASPIAIMLRDLARTSSEVLAGTAAGLALPNAPEEDELAAALKDMPRLETGSLDINIRQSKIALKLSLAWAQRRVERKLLSQIGDPVSTAFSHHGKLLEAWSRRTLADLQARFDSYADAYRAQLDRLLARTTRTTAEEESIRRDLAEIAGSGAAEMQESTIGA